MGHKNKKTRMHSSGMRTVHFSGHRGGGDVCLGGVCLGGCLPGGCLPGEWLPGGCLPRVVSAGGVFTLLGRHPLGRHTLMKHYLPATIATFKPRKYSAFTHCQRYFPNHYCPPASSSKEISNMSANVNKNPESYVRNG